MAEGPAVESLKKFTSPVERWDAELRAYERTAEQWKQDRQRIGKRYALKDKPASQKTPSSRFNILWSNVETQMPALFSADPVPVAERQHRDNDPLGRIAATTIERATKTEMERDNLSEIVEQCTQDVLLGGRGTAWGRRQSEIVSTTVPVTASETEGMFKDEEGNEYDDTDITQDDDGNYMRKVEDVAGESAPVDYVHPDDLAHKPVKTWEECKREGWVARRLRFTREEGVKEFGEIFEKVPLTAKPVGMDDDDISKANQEIVMQGEVWEIWDAPSRKVIHICREYKEAPLRERPDPLGLNGFFPCPKPVYASMTNDSLMPIPDYLQYESLAKELDETTRRINMLTKALRVTGIYDATMQAIGNMLSDTSQQNRLYPVDGLSDLLGKGSTGAEIRNVIQFMPIDTIAAAMVSLYQSREQTKQVLFEVSGLSDVLRGQVDPREKLGQTRIKGQFATGRIERRRRKIARFVRDLIRIKAEIIAEHFDPKTIRELSGFDFLPEVVAIEANQPGSADAAFEEVIGLLRDDRLRGFRIDIETDSTVEIDQQAAKDSRTELLAAISPFIREAVPLVQAEPQAGPLVANLLTFVIRGFRAGRNIEAAFDQFAEQLQQQSVQLQQQAEQQAAAPAEQQGPTPEEIEAQAKQQEQQLKLQKMQQDMQIKGQEGQLKQMLANMALQEQVTELQIKQLERALAEYKLQAAQVAMA